MSTKKIWALLLILVIACAATVTAYVIVDKQKSKEEQEALLEAAELVLFSFDSDDIDKIEIQNDDGYFLTELIDGTWTLTMTDYPDDFILNTYYIYSVCNYMSALEATKKLDISVNDLASYGLLEPSVITCYASDGITQHTLYIGKAAATEEYYYVMIDDNATVFEIDYTTGDVLKGGIAYMRDPYMLNCLDVDINAVKLERNGEIIFDIYSEDSTWTMTSPLSGTELNSANISSMLSTLTRLEIESFVTIAKTATDLYPFGLDNPAYQLVVKTESESYTIDFADFDKNDGSVYLVYEETGQVVTMAASNLGFLQTETSELLSDKILSIDFADAVALDVQVDDLSFSMTMNYDEDSYLLNAIDIQAQDETIWALFKSLYLTVSNMNYDSLDTEANPKASAYPAAVFHYTLTDGTERELTLEQIDETYYYAFVDGEYTGKIVRRRALSDNTGVLTYYEKISDALAENDIYLE